LLVIAAPEARGQSAAPLKPADVTSFLGVWPIEMTEPPEFKGTHTIRVWDNGGTVAASIQTNPRSTAIEATGVYKDGNMLVLTVSHQAKPRPMLENGAPIWAVVSAVVDGDTMKVALMLERSSTIKRGAGSRQSTRP
jgi:hypothetical protein